MKSQIFYAVAMTATAAISAIPCASYAQETPSTAPAQAAPANPAAPAPTAAVAPKPGDTVYDNTGASIGPVESVMADRFVLSSAAGKATLKTDSLAMGTNGLMINMTKAQFEAAVTAAHGGKAAS
jgi:hypothetical protein